MQSGQAFDVSSYPVDLKGQGVSAGSPWRDYVLVALNMAGANFVSWRLRKKVATSKFPSVVPIRLPSSKMCFFGQRGDMLMRETMCHTSVQGQHAWLPVMLFPSPPL